VPTQEKVETIEDLKTRLRGVKTVLLTEYRGLSVAQLSDLRKQLRSVSAEYKIVKNRLARLALSSDLSAVGTHLKGPTGMILSREDAVAVAKTLHTFARTNTALVIKAGYVEGQMLPPDGLKALADLPSKGPCAPQSWAPCKDRWRSWSASSRRPSVISSTSWSSAERWRPRPLRTRRRPQRRRPQWPQVRTQRPRTPRRRPLNTSIKETE
jgi:large subunit ribosomal protein L10